MAAQDLGVIQTISIVLSIMGTGACVAIYVERSISGLRKELTDFKLGLPETLDKIYRRVETCNQIEENRKMEIDHLHEAFTARVKPAKGSA